MRRQLLDEKKLLDAKRSKNNGPCERTRVREGAEENMEVKTMAKLIECGLKIERGLKRRLTGKEGEGYGEEGGLEVNHHHWQWQQRVWKIHKSQMDLESWCYKWTAGRMDGLDHQVG